MGMNIFDLFKKKPKKDAATSLPKPAPDLPEQNATPSLKPTSGASVDASGKTPAQVLAEGMVNVRDIIAPSAMEIDFNHIRIGNTYYRTFFVSGYPRFVGANWLSPIINFDHSLDLSMFYYPVKSKMILDDLRRKITELEATIINTKEKGKLVDPVVTAALEDANALQEQLVKGVEKYFKFSFYITVPADSLDELEAVCARLESSLGALLLISKSASLQMEAALQSTIPAGLDKLLVTRNMDTTSLATTFPFTSSDLTMEEGIMYGINRHNGSLIIFERFSLENANTVVFAKSGSGKSYFVKLEALRLMVFGAEVMIIDPEEEYRSLCDAVGGNYIDFSANSPAKINPFDLSGIAVEGENELGQKLISLITLFKLVLGGLSATEEALLDRALIETYRIKGITPDPDTQMTKEPPVMEDLYKVLLGMDEKEARSMAERLEKFIKGSMTGIFDAQSNIDLESKMTVFSTKNLEEALRPIAFYMILDFVWTRIRKDLKKRILIVEEAWYLLQNEDSARFIYGIAKRARKYYLGLTTVSQDVDDFLGSEYGKAIVTNSSIQVLLKQHPAAIDQVAETFYLSEGEKRLLLSAGVGEGLFFAGSNHVAIRVMASDAEHRLITTNPEELLKLKAEGIIKPKSPQPQKKTYTQYVPPADPNKYKTFDESGKPKPGFEPNSVGGAQQQKPNNSPGQPLPQKPISQSANPTSSGVPPQSPPKPPVQPPTSPSSAVPPRPASPSSPPQPNKPPMPTSGSAQNNIAGAPKEMFESKPRPSPDLPSDYRPSGDDILRSVQQAKNAGAPNNQTNQSNQNSPNNGYKDFAPKPTVMQLGSDNKSPGNNGPKLSGAGNDQNRMQNVSTIEGQGSITIKQSNPVQSIKDEMSALGKVNPTKPF